jgi:uncharacterized protein YndB with AHSA1/START domain
MIDGKAFEVSTPTPREVMMTRAFDAPPRLVFEAMTNPQYISRWYGPHGFAVVLCETDLRVGGAYRIVQRTPDGSEFGFRGVHREIVAPSRRVYTWIFEAMPDKEAVITETFEADGVRRAHTLRDAGRS